jgi:hypothetical protein
MLGWFHGIGHKSELLVIAKIGTISKFLYCENTAKDIAAGVLLSFQLWIIN